MFKSELIEYRAWPGPNSVPSRLYRALGSRGRGGGTEGSNPSLSTSESDANLTFSGSGRTNPRPCYPDEVLEQKRVNDGVPRVLLAGGHDQRRSGYAGIEQAAEAMAEPAGGVKIDKAGRQAACA
jgi:hypothetical protein